MRIILVVVIYFLCFMPLNAISEIINLECKYTNNKNQNGVASIRIIDSLIDVQLKYPFVKNSLSAIEFSSLDGKIVIFEDFISDDKDSSINSNLIMNSDEIKGTHRFYHKQSKAFILSNLTVNRMSGFFTASSSFNGFQNSNEASFITSGSCVKIQQDKPKF